ncbi:MAG: DUF1549 domain-containing protein [Planctomycetota bacterium]|nr:DUF1549 domain-containing protein [Planctomycetota bacterium]
MKIYCLTSLVSATRIFAILSVLMLMGEAQGAAPLEPISKRLATAQETTTPADAIGEIPDFQRHVTPLLGRLGCNGRACHGSFQGQGGFQLSLFGYDFKKDFAAITEKDSGRVDKKKPASSLLLQKPTLRVEHEGGQRMPRDGWEYQVLKRWIEGGAKPAEAKSATLTRLEVTPHEIIFGKTTEQQSLKIVAHWSDGSSEDVTPISRFRSNDDSIAKIDEHGVITSTDSGDTHVVVFYDSGVVPIPVILPYSQQVKENYPAVPTPTEIDSLVVDKLKKLGVVPSELSSDEDFLRRVSLDLTGTLPAADEIKSFLADTSKDKRDRKIDELLSRPAYADWWATRICDLTGNNPVPLNNVIFPAAEEWFYWVKHRVEQNVPYDQIVSGIVLSQSRTKGQSFVEYCKETAKQYGPNKSRDFADRDNMPHYWARKNFRLPDDRAMGFAYSFMGQQIQCAQCHKHPFDRWTKQDFDEFKPFFARVEFGSNPQAADEAKELLATLDMKIDAKSNLQMVRQKLRPLLLEGQAVPLTEVYVVPPGGKAELKKQASNVTGKKKPVSPQFGRVLGGEKVDLSKVEDPRTIVVDWLKNEPKHYLARAFVNRVWANYFHVGIVHPTDDMNLANPPSNAPLLDYLTEGFVKHNYDMKWLHREICRSQTYQLSWKPNDTNKRDSRNFSHAIPRRMPAEVAYDAVNTATLATPTDALKEIEKRYISLASTLVTSKGNAKGFYAGHIWKARTH